MRASSPSGWPRAVSSSRPQTSHCGSLSRSSAAVLHWRGYAQRFWYSRWTIGCSGASCSRM
eukprot:9592341-Karenia_brevis.AAC.1